MSGLSLFPDPHPPAVEGIDLRCCDVSEVLAEVRGARLVHADPPWTYDRPGVQGAAQAHYGLLTMPEIAEHIALTVACAAPEAYLSLWTTWPKLGEWQAASADIGWTYKTGGCWGKTDRLGVGFHWRGDSEPVLLYVNGKPRPVKRNLSNLHNGPRTDHSEKPLAFLIGMVQAFTEPGDLVLDLYAGLGPMARACKLTGRRYIGAEVDPDRHLAALARLAQVRT